MEMSRRLLVSVAHPDDESFGMAGTIARYTGEGVAVYLICMTNGDVGEVDASRLAGYRSIGELRMAELCCAAQELGLAHVYAFGYRDSGMAGSADNHHPESLNAADLDEVTGRVVKVIREVRPHVVITFDPFGGYGHPDHIKTHEATTRAFFAAGDPSQYAEQIADGLHAYQPQKLYYMTFDRRVLKVLVRLMPLFGQDPRHMGRNGDIDYVEIARHAYPIHAYINTRAVAEKAERARQCHASQLGGIGRPTLMQRARRLFTGLYNETYMRAYPPVENRRVREIDLFDGVTAD